MANGSFSRGRDAISASASMVFVGSISQSVDTLVNPTGFFACFAFEARFHFGAPGGGTGIK